MRLVATEGPAPHLRPWVVDLKCDVLFWKVLPMLIEGFAALYYEP